MPSDSPPQTSPAWAAYDPTSESSNIRIVERILAEGLAAGASDIHLLPEADSLRMLWRIDGVLHPVAAFPKPAKTGIIARLKVLSGLLTYRTDLPQEGRLQPDPLSAQTAEVRVSTFPTIHGEKGVIRLFAESAQFASLPQLHLDAAIETGLGQALQQTSGAVIIAGPAGSGKTTTAYACLRQLAADTHGRRSLVSLEDPVEGWIPGVAQSQVNPQVGFDYATGLRSLMRQDPDVLFVGEIRDRTVATTVIQASLTGHLVLTTFHAGSAAEALVRLGDMGIDAYLIRSGVRAVVSQRLLRRLCDCATWAESAELPPPFTTQRQRLPAGCERCRGTGYAGRFPVAEMLSPASEAVGQAIRDARGTAAVQAAAEAEGMTTLRAQAVAAVTEGTTSFAEFCRVLGIP